MDSLKSLQDRRAGREHGHSHWEILRDRLLDKRVTESGDSSGYDSRVPGNMSMSRKQDPEEQWP